MLPRSFKSEDFIAKLRDMEVAASSKKVSFIGICGGSASGKTTLCTLIEKYYKDQANFLVISTDSFYKVLSPEEHARACRNEYNFDDPEAIDFDLLVECLTTLERGEPFSIPNYSYVEHNRMFPPPPPSEPTKVILVEGIHAFCDERVRKMFSLSVFIEVPMDIMLARRIRRDTVERARTVDGIIEQYMRFVRGGYINFIEPTKRFAHVILKSDPTLVKGLMLVLTKLDRVLMIEAPFDEEKEEMLKVLMEELNMIYKEDGSIMC